MLIAIGRGTQEPHPRIDHQYHPSMVDDHEWLVINEPCHKPAIEGKEILKMDNQVPRQKLCEIVGLYGLSIVNDADKCEQILRECCPEYGREIHALTNCMREGAVAGLLTVLPGSVDEEITLALSGQLEQNLGLDKNIAKWAVESWALALQQPTLANVHHTDSGPVSTVVQNIATPVSQDLSNISPSSYQVNGDAESRRRPTIKLVAATIAIALFAGGGAFGYQQWQQRIETQKAEEEALRQADQARKTAQEQIRQAALKAEEEQRQLELKQEKERQDKAIDDERRVKLETQKLEQVRLENQRRQLDLQERQERARIESQQRQLELRERQEQARLESQRRQQENLDRQRELQAQRQREAQERAAQQRQRGVLDNYKPFGR